MLGYDDLGLSRHGRLTLGPVILRTVDEHHYVGILLYGSRLAEVAELGTLVAAAGLDGTAELGKGYHRYVQFLGYGLERARDIGHLLLPHAAQLRRTGHKLKVVYDDELDSGVAHQAAGLGAQLIYRKRRSIVNVKRSRSQVLYPLVKLDQLVLLQFLSSAYLLRRESGLGDQKSLDQLLG